MGYTLVEKDESQEHPCENIQVDRSTHTMVNDRLHAINMQRHDSIPLDSLLQAFPLHMWNNIREALAGIYCGREGRTVIYFAKHSFVIGWYKLPVTNQYEITAYLS